MSLGAELLDEYAYELYHDLSYLAYEEDPIWTTRNGEEIPVSKMTTTHIENCLRLGVREEWKKVFEKELRKRRLSF